MNNNPTKLQPAKFQIDYLGDKVFEGYTQGEVWNGWAIPLFTLEVALEITALMHKPELGDHVIFHEAENVFTFHCEGVDEQYYSQHFGDKELYPLGGGNWIWEQL